MLGVVTSRLTPSSRLSSEVLVPVEKISPAPSHMVAMVAEFRFAAVLIVSVCASSRE